MNRRLRITILILSLFLCGMAGRPPLVGSPAPPFGLENIDGKVTRLSDFKGEFVVLNFWATWCLPCTREMPEFQKAHHELHDDHIRVIGINFAESKESVEEFARKMDITFPLLLDGYGNIAQDYEILNLPVTYIISPDGIVREKIFGGGLTRAGIEARVEKVKRAYSSVHTRKESLSSEPGSQEIQAARR